MLPRAKDAQVTRPAIAWDHPHAVSKIESSTRHHGEGANPIELEGQPPRMAEVHSQDIARLQRDRVPVVYTWGTEPIVDSIVGNKLAQALQTQAGAGTTLSSPGGSSGRRQFGLGGLVPLPAQDHIHRCRSRRKAI
jgi:hypothetical protein